MNHQYRGRFVLTLCVLGLLSVSMGLSACSSSPPRGNSGGRIDPYSTTRGDLASDSASMPALLEFSDRSTDTFSQKMANIPAVRAAQTQKVLYLGDINNKTRTPTNDFVMIQNRVRDTLVSSSHIRDNFILAEDPSRLDAQKRRLTGGQSKPDLLQEGTGGGGGTSRYKAEDIYLLTGDFFETNRGATRRYYFVFRLTHLQSGSIELNERFDLGQQ